MYSKLILFFFQRNKNSSTFLSCVQAKKKGLKKHNKYTFFSYMYERKRNFFRTVISEQRSVIREQRSVIREQRSVIREQCSDILLIIDH